MDRAAMPHCDQRVLHAPGTCEYCDKYPEWQDARRKWGINFTGQYEPGKTLCPSEVDRKIEDINRWPGNRAKSASEPGWSAGGAPPVDRTQRVLTDGGPVTPDYTEIDPATGQQKDYVVLTPEERAKGFVRPVRRTYTHQTCGTDTMMGLALAETYARDPGFYDGTFCARCRTHFPLTEFVWKGTEEQVGS